MRVLTPEQKASKKESNRRYYEANREKIRLQAKNYYLKNRDEIIAKVVAYEEANKEARQEYRAEYYIRHKDGKIKEYYEANRDRISEAHRQWLQDNAQHVTDYAKRYYAENTDLVKSRCKSYYDRNKHVFTAKANKRRAAFLNAIPSWADLDEIKNVYLEAKHFGYHVDHIIPLQGKTVCGLHVWENLQVIPPAENLKKSNKFDESLLT